MPDFSKPFILQTDAIGVAVAAVLLQETCSCGRSMAYASRTLSVQERKALSAYKAECLPVVFGIEKFRPRLEYKNFLLDTDKQALSTLLHHPRQIGKTGRWVVKISALKFKVQQIWGTLNVIADTLSHMYDETPALVSEVSCYAVFTTFPLAFEDIPAVQGQEPENLNIIRKLKR
jgi:hypothetical protein